MYKHNNMTISNIRSLLKKISVVNLNNNKIKNEITNDLEYLDDFVDWESEGV